MSDALPAERDTIVPNSLLAFGKPLRPFREAHTTRRR